MVLASKDDVVSCVAKNVVWDGACIPFEGTEVEEPQQPDGVSMTSDKWNKPLDGGWTQRKALWRKLKDEVGTEATVALRKVGTNVWVKIRPQPEDVSKLKQAVAGFQGDLQFE